MQRRVRSIDLLRGIVMVLMALDHVRDYFTNVRYSPTDIEHTYPALFFTRWITHFCAPVFMLLSGTSAFLSMQQGKSKGKAARFLLQRGLWLVLLELTVVRAGWQFNVNYQLTILQVIWALGLSMIVLSGLIFLPRPLIATIAVLMIGGHHLLDAIPSWQTDPDRLAVLLHEPGNFFQSGNHTFLLMYPLIPWAGVMAAGYCLGPVFRSEPKKRNRTLLYLGLGMMVLFVVLRWLNVYGDEPWQQQDTATKSLLAFLNTGKYPPSLLYLLMTLGPALALMPLLEKWTGRFAEIISVYGKVPLFYYLLHIYLVHGLALLAGLAMGFPLSLFTDMMRLFNTTSGWGFSLGGVYLWWLLVVALLYFPCRWFMHLKMRHRKWWLSYL